MTKCEKCGHFNPYWRADWRDTEREFARKEDVYPHEMPLNLLSLLNAGDVVEWNGFAWKLSEKYVRRLPVEIYRARGRWGLPYKSKLYFDPAMRQSGLDKK